MAYRYSEVVSHEGLNKSKVITDTDPQILQLKARQQMTVWEEEWQRRRAAEQEREWRHEEQEARRDAAAQERTQRQSEREAAREELESKKRAATERTEEARKAIEALRTIIETALGSSHPLVWGTLKSTSPFPEATPTKPIFVPNDAPFPAPRPHPPAASPAPPEPPAPSKPLRGDLRYKPHLGVGDLLSPTRRRAREEEARRLYERDMAAWSRATEEGQAQWRLMVHQRQQREAEQAAAHQSALAQWQRERGVFLDRQAAENQARQEGLEREHAAAVARRQEKKAKFERQQAEQNGAVDALHSQYDAGTPEAVSAYCEMVLSRSVFPESFPGDPLVEYNAESKMLIVECCLPTVEQMPRVKEIKYVQSRDEFAESCLPEREVSALYDDALYQTAIATMHELYDADAAGALDGITFNGWVTAVDRSTGNEVTACVMSVQTTQVKFAKINLDAVDPKACFKSLKGIAASKLHIVTPVAPVLSISREDSRFVAGREVVAGLDEGDNLAAMDWEDFEHLIRELFEEEFSRDGGEVKVTQASRDGGVDAVAFDADPIRGGKTVIQAKRYTNTVGVSAVRDLYGSVMNEGAMKGILVTTSSYGPDAYEFAKGKPLTLLSGAELLYMLARHGHKAKIDIAEARRILAEREAAERRGE